MECTSCGGQLPSGARYCPHCGAAVEPERSADSALSASPPPENAPVEEQLRWLRGVVNDLNAELAVFSERLSAVEGAASGSPGPADVAPESQPRPAPAPRQSVSPAYSSQPGPETAPVDGLAAPSVRGVLDSVAGWNWEWLLGGNWLARIGILALIIGVGFFLKMAFDNDWIGETGRVALGIAGGLLLLAAGEFWRRRYPIWAQPLTGGGIAILYLSIFAAFSFYGLIPSLPALGFFFLVTAAAAGLALRYEAITIAILGIIGGFATPFMLWEQLPDQRALLAYVMVLDLGVLALATFRNWRWFTLLALLGSLGLFILWREELEPSLLLAQVGITLIFLIFVGATTLFHILWKRPAGPADFSLMVLNAGAYFATSYSLMFEALRPWMGGFTLVLAVFYGLLAYGTFLRAGKVVHLTLFAVGIGLVFLTIAVPVQLGGPWVGLTWAAEGAVVMWVSFVLRMRQLRWSGVAIFVAFAAWTLAVDTPMAFIADLTPLWNAYALVYGLSLALVYLTAYLFYRHRDLLQPWEHNLFPAFLTAGNLILTVAIPTQVAGVWMTVAWAVEAALLAGLSFYLNLSQLRLFSLGVFGLVVARLLTFDTFFLDLGDFTPIINERFLAFAVGIGCAYLLAVLWQVKRELFVDDREKYLVVAFLVAANALTLWILSAEIIQSVGSGFLDVSPGAADNIISLSLSVLWAVYAAALIIVGIAKSSRWARVAGLGLLAVPIIKLFAYDIFSLEREFRVAAFLGLGAILVIGGFLYQRYSRQIRGFLLE